MPVIYRAGGGGQTPIPKEFCSFLQCKKVGHGLGGVLEGLRNLGLFEVVVELHSLLQTSICIDLYLK